jgi:hypothetical protein
MLEMAESGSGVSGKTPAQLLLRFPAEGPGFEDLKTARIKEAYSGAQAGYGRAHKRFAFTAGFDAIGIGVTIKGLVTAPSAPFAEGVSPKLKTTASPTTKEKITHGSKGWHQRLWPHWPQCFARRAG